MGLQPEPKICWEFVGFRRLSRIFASPTSTARSPYLADEIFLNLICAYVSDQVQRGHVLEVRQLTPPQELPVILNDALESGMNIHVVDDGVQDVVDVEPFALAERHYY